MVVVFVFVYAFVFVFVYVFVLVFVYVFVFVFFIVFVFAIWSLAFIHDKAGGKGEPLVVGDWFMVSVSHLNYFMLDYLKLLKLVVGNHQLLMSVPHLNNFRVGFMFPTLVPKCL